MKYKFKNKEYKALRRLVLAVVEQYVKDNQDISYLDLKEKFPKSVHGSMEMILNESDFVTYDARTKTAKDRYLFVDGITLDNEKIFVASGWGDDLKNGKKGNKKSFLDHINHNFSYVIEELDDKKSSKEKYGVKNMQPLNKILYGPPGTGKTYNTINKALQIIDGTVSEDRKEVKERFEALKDAGQIEFVTFHQSYGYEEFVEGIKAKTVDSGIEYRIEAGIFKVLSDKAKTNFLNSKKSKTGFLEELSMRDTVDRFLNKSLENETAFTKTKGGKFYIKDFTENAIQVFTEDSKYNQNNIELVLEEFYKIVQSDIEFSTSRQIAKEVFGISNQRQKDTYYFSIYKEFKKEPAVVTSSQDYREDMQNYILIIDEINRGNISKIFGELITLIEESKRLGNEEAMEVTLPYSGEKFGVPKNLYIIGTMNTADRSIALMDTALRRRFEFEEMMPKPELLEEVEGIDLVKLLIKINQRIEYLYDRDHTIGHAYFMGVTSKDELDSVMKNKVIPLLQEYFYDDWEKIRLVLNDGFIERTLQDSSKLFDDGMDDEYIEDEKYRYRIAGNFTADSYRKIYGKMEEIQVGENHE